MIRLSFSAAQRYLQSPMSYFLYYIKRIRPAKLSSPLVFGAAMDEGLNSLLIDKKEGREVNVEKAKAAFCAAFYTKDDLCLGEPGVVSFSKSDLDENLLTQLDYSSGLDLAWCSLNRKGQILIEEYAAQVIPRIRQVLDVQRSISTVNEAGDELTGIADFICEWDDGKRYLADNKTSSVRYEPDSAEKSEQLATYYEFLKDEFNLDGVMYVVVPKRVRSRKKPAVEISFFFGQVSEDLLDRAFFQYDEVLEGIRTGKFYCTPDKCCAKWRCDYATYCRSGGEDLTGLVIAEKR